MLCCVSRKASARPSANKKQENNAKSQQNPKSILQFSPSSSTSSSSAYSSCFSASNFTSTDNFDSSVTSGLTPSCDTSGFSSSPLNPENSSSDSATSDPANIFAAGEANFFDKNPDIVGSAPFPPEFPLPKPLQTFATPAKRDCNISPRTLDVNPVLGQESTKDEPTELLPCAICARTFKPQSLEKHTRVCERSAAKKRKPFDSAKQRIQGTDLAEFMPKEPPVAATTKRKIHLPDEKGIANRGSWKQTHDEFLRAIRAARGETIDATPARHAIPVPSVTIGAPTRPNEKGLCPTCNRQFSIKSYERHVEWCKEKATRVPLSAATNIAKERLEARMKYRVPQIKSRRTIVREKYSPQSAMNLANSAGRPKESLSTPNCSNNNNNSNNKTGNEMTATNGPKTAINTRRSGQSREGISSGPMKSRLSDRSNRPMVEPEADSATNYSSPRQNSSCINNNIIQRSSRYSPMSSRFPNNSSRRDDRQTESARKSFAENSENREKQECLEKNEPEKKIRQAPKNHFRSKKNFVHARSCGNPRVNDVTINDDVIGMTVRPCFRKNIDNNDEEGFVTWKEIGETQLGNNRDYFKFQSIASLNHNSKDGIGTIDDTSNEKTIDEKTILELKNLSGHGIVDRTYVIRKSKNDLNDCFEQTEQKIVVHSPRIPDFYEFENNFGGPLDEESDDRSADIFFIDDSNPLNCGVGQNCAMESKEIWSRSSDRSSRKSRKSVFHSPRIYDFWQQQTLENNFDGTLDEEIVDQSADTCFINDSNPLNCDLGPNCTKGSKKSSRKSSKSSTFVQPKLEPLDLTMIQYDETPHSSAKTPKNSAVTCRRILPKKETSKSVEPKKKVEKSSTLEVANFLAGEKNKVADFVENSSQDALLKTGTEKSLEISGKSGKNEFFYQSKKISENSTEIDENREIISSRLEIHRNDIFEGKNVDDSVATCPYKEFNSQFNDIKGNNVDILDISKSLTAMSRSYEKSFDKSSTNASFDCSKISIHKSTATPNVVSENTYVSKVLAQKMTELQTIAANLDFFKHKNCNKRNNSHSSKIRDEEIAEAGVTYKDVGKSFDQPLSNKLSTSEKNAHENDKTTSASDEKSSDLENEFIRNLQIDENNDGTEKHDKTEEKLEKTGEKNANDYKEKSIALSRQKGNSKFEKTSNSSSEKEDIRPSTNYQRCGTYVIEKKSATNFTTKHEAADELFDEKPLKKRRTMEVDIGNNETKKNLLIDEPTIENSQKLPKSNNRSEKTNKNGKNDEKNGPNKEKSKTTVQTVLCTKEGASLKRVSEKFLNNKFNYDSDETILTEIFSKDFSAPESSEKLNKKSSDKIGKTILEIPARSFSDSWMVVQENNSLETVFSNTTNEPVTQNFSKSPKKLQRETLLENIFPKVDEMSELKLCSDGKFEKTLSLETIFQKEPKKLEARNCPDYKMNWEEKKCPVPNSSAMAKLEVENQIVNEYEIKSPKKPEINDSLEIKRKLRETMKILRGSTNKMIRSIETSDGGAEIGDKSIGHVVYRSEKKSRHEFEEETIHRIDFGNLGKIAESQTRICGFLPEIPIDRINAKNHDSRNTNRINSSLGSTFTLKRPVKNLIGKLIDLNPPRFYTETKYTSGGLSKNEKLPSLAQFQPEKRRISDRDSRPVWSNYVRRHPDFNLVLTGRTGSCKDYDPFLIAERQMNELLSDTCSEQSLTDSASITNHRRGLSPTLPNYPLTHSSAFVKYPESTKVAKSPKGAEKRASLLAPPTEFDDFSSDSTETNSITRETNNSLQSRPGNESPPEDLNPRKNGPKSDHVLGRRVIIDKSKALGVNKTDESPGLLGLEKSACSERLAKKLDKNGLKVARSNSVRIAQAPKIPEKSRPNCSAAFSVNKSNSIRNSRNNNYASLSGSNVSLSSIVSSEIDVKRSNSMFDELTSSYEEDDTSGIYPSLGSLLKNDSLSVTSPIPSNRTRINGHPSDEEFSSPDSYKRQHDNKLSADSAYSSLNRKYSNHGRSTNDMTGRQEQDDSPLRRREIIDLANNRSKMSKFCHECGSRFPETAKFCCECGIRRLAL